MKLRFEVAGTTDLEPLYELNKSLIEQYEDLSSIDLPAVLAWVRKKLTKKLDEYRTVFLNDEKVGYFRLCEGGDDSLLKSTTSMSSLPIRDRESVQKSSGTASKNPSGLKSLSCCTSLHRIPAPCVCMKKWALN